MYNDVGSTCTSYLGNLAGLVTDVIIHESILISMNIIKLSLMTIHVHVHVQPFS